MAASHHNVILQNAHDEWLVSQALDSGS